jgi:hypothetical protein
MMMVLESTKLIESCSITIDGWSGVHIEYFIGLTLHWIDSNWRMQKCFMGILHLPGSKTSQYLSYMVKIIYSKFLTEKAIIGSIISDQGANYKKCTKILLGDDDAKSCAAHDIQNVVLKGLTKTHANLPTNPITMINLVKDLVSTVKSRADLREIVGKTGYVTDSPTRWDSFMLMLSDFLKDMDKFLLVKEAIDQSGVGWPSVEYLKQVIAVLQPALQFTKSVCKDSFVTASSVPTLVHGLIQEWSPRELDNDYCKALRANLLDEMKNKFGWILTDSTTKNVYLLASIFDPRFGHLHFVEKEVKDGIWRTAKEEILDMEMEGMVINGQTCLDQSSLDKLRESKAVILEHQLLILRTTFEDKNFRSQHKDFDPLEYWKTDKNLLALHEYAKLQLCTMSSSAPVERSFKSASRFSTDDRPNLEPENVEMCTFIRENYRFIKDCSISDLLDKILEMKQVDTDLAIHLTDLPGEETVDDEDVEAMGEVWELSDEE